MYVCLCVSACIHAYLCACVCVYVCVCVSVCVHVHVHLKNELNLQTFIFKTQSSQKAISVKWFICDFSTTATWRVPELLQDS